MTKKPPPSIDLKPWYDQHGRTDLPWRMADTPYPIYLSEVMLQQTQVKTVLDRYYFQFIERFPSLQALADAPEDDVLKMWEGLGYYNRARNLHKTAKLVAPALPSTIEALIKLPGIGRNTAHAVACFAFGHAVPILEANVKRILYRLFAREQASDKELWGLAEQVLNKEDAFTHNQALMDIGSIICTPKAPKCTECPLFEHCLGKEYPQIYPTPKTKKKTPTRQKAIIIIMQPNGDIMMKARTSLFLGGLYGFYELDLPKFQSKDIVGLPELNIVKNELTLLGGVTQTYSHFKLDAELYLYRATNKITTDAEWFSIDQLSTLAMSRADSKAVALLKHHIEN